MHSGYVYGARNADGSRILEFTDGLNLVICNTLFMKHESKLVTYVAGSNTSMVDYIIIWQRIKAKIHNVIVIPNEECVPKHKLFIMNMQFNTTNDGVRSSSIKAQGGTDVRNTKAWSEITWRKQSGGNTLM